MYYYYCINRKILNFYSSLSGGRGMGGGERRRGNIYIYIHTNKNNWQTRITAWGEVRRHRCKSFETRTKTRSQINAVKLNHSQGNIKPRVPRGPSWSDGRRIRFIAPGKPWAEERVRIPRNIRGGRDVQPLTNIVPFAHPQRHHSRCAYITSTPRALIHKFCVCVCVCICVFVCVCVRADDECCCVHCYVHYFIYNVTDNKRVEGWLRADRNDGGCVFCFFYIILYRTRVSSVFLQSFKPVFLIRDNPEFEHIIINNEEILNIKSFILNIIFNTYIQSR